MRLKSYLAKLLLALTYLTPNLIYATSGVCDRSTYIRETLEYLVGTECANISAEDLEKIQYLNTTVSPAQELKADDLKGLTNLRELHLKGYLMHTGISKVAPNAFQDQKSLELLNLSSGMFEELPENIFSKMDKLRNLNLENGMLLNMPKSFFKLSNLEVLTLSGSYALKINDIDFSTITSLKELHLVKMRYQALDPKMLATLGSLDVLDLSWSDLDYTNLKLNGLTVKDLRLPQPNKMVSGDIFEGANIEKLKICSSNGKKNLVSKESFLHLKSLKSLYLDCVIKIPKNLLDHIIHLSEFSANTSGLPVEEISFDSSFADKIKNIESFKSIGIPLEKYSLNFFSSFTNLKNLHLQRLCIDCFKTNDKGFKLIHDMHNLKKLSLPMNSIVNLDDELFLNHKLVEDLDLSYNKLSELKFGLFQHLTNMRRLDLHRNQMDTFYEHAFRNPTSGEDIFDNIEELNLSGINNNGDGNGRVHLLTRSFHNFRNLKKLRLDRNQIENLPRTFLEKNAKLEYFDLSFNQIDGYIPGTFKYLKNLKYLNITANLMDKNSIQRIRSEISSDVYFISEI